MAMQKLLIPSLMLLLHDQAMADTRDTLCQVLDTPGCSGPFPPGHTGVTRSWWAIGSESYGVRIQNFSVVLSLPKASKQGTGVTAIVPSIERTVCVVQASSMLLEYTSVVG